MAATVMGAISATPAVRLKSLIAEINRQCKSLGAQDDLTWELKDGLESLSADERRAVVGCVVNGCAPLFKACRVGNVKVAKYLIEKCGADVDQTGITVDDGTQKCHSATPLWCAAVKGYANLVSLLLSAGADINAVTDSGSTAVRSACYSSQFDIVRMLVEHGADILRPNHNGGTCLINSVQLPELCRFLVDRGADVDAQDVVGKTAAHYAAEEGFLDSLDILVQAGADLFLKTVEGDSPLRLACSLGQEEAALKLLDLLSPKLRPRERADYAALLGASLFHIRSDLEAAAALWRHAVEELGQPDGLVDDAFSDESDERDGASTLLSECPLLAGKKEFRTEEELSNILDEIDNVRTQSLLITQRVLGWNHPETMQRILSRGGSFVESGRLRDAMWLWMELLARELQQNGILGELSLFVLAGSILPLLTAYKDGIGLVNCPEPLTFDMALQLIELLMPAVTWSRRLLEVAPQSKTQTELFDDVLTCIPYFLHIAQAESDENSPKLLSLCSRLGGMNSRFLNSEASILHCAASGGIRIRTASLLGANGVLPDIFPSEPVVRLLLKARWNPNVVDADGRTPLHWACFPINSCGNRHHSPLPHLHNHQEDQVRRAAVVRLLLDAGCHVDRVDDVGRSAYNVAARLVTGARPVLSLKCLAAQKVRNNVNVASRLPPSSAAEEDDGNDLSVMLPVELQDFLALHADPRQCEAMHLHVSSHHHHHHHHHQHPSASGVEKQLNRKLGSLSK